MRARIQHTFEAVAVRLIGAGIGCLLAPQYAMPSGYAVPVSPLPAMVSVGLIGLVGYFALCAIGQTWGAAAFRFSIREIVLLTVIVAVACGWLVDRTTLRAWYADEIFRSDNSLWKHTERISTLKTFLDQRAPGWRKSVPESGK